MGVDGKPACQQTGQGNPFQQGIGTAVSDIGERMHHTAQLRATLPAVDMYCAGLHGSFGEGKHHLSVIALGGQRRNPALAGIVLRIKNYAQSVDG